VCVLDKVSILLIKHILYVNAQIRDETELGKLMHDMWCVEPEDMHYSVLAEWVR